MLLDAKEVAFSEINAQHPAFKFVEAIFDRWLDRQDQESKDMYLSEDAIYEPRGAILGAIEAAYNESHDSGAPVDLAEFDLAAFFEC